MKTKLLKRVRRKYSIVYYPNGFKGLEGELYHVGKYLVETTWTPRAFSYGYETREQALDRIMREVREKYSAYSRKYNKTSYKGIKVWYNNNKY